MKIVNYDEISSCLQLGDLIDPVREAFRAYSRGDSSDAIAHLHPPGGEVHIKAGALAGSKVFAVKIATGFPENATRGLPVWDGIVLAMDAKSGEPVVLIQDRGLLTDWRTAVAGAIVTQALARKTTSRIGLVGTGIQAFWQPQAHRALMQFDSLAIWGRDPTKAAALCRRLEPLLDGVRVEVEPSLEALVGSVDVLITTTSSSTPVICHAWVHPGLHITAVGADTDAKQELELEILARAGKVVVDSLEVNLRYGEVARAVKAGLLRQGAVIELGALLSAEQPARHPDEITVGKLVGLGVQDLAAVSALLASLP